jgi:2-succinyl-6-hydroxy-2,4-cyclohexadiene-1-carboxylate synthase
MATSAAPNEPAASEPGPRLAAQRFVPEGATAGRLVLVHGFTQTSACWSPVDADLAVDHELVLLDAPGHGASAPIAADLPTGARAMVTTGGRATYLGYSMGARFCLHAALANPTVVDRLVLISGTAGIDDAGERAERRQRDERLADHVVEVGVERFVDEWLAQPMFAALTPAHAHRRARLANTADGLASSLRLAGTGTQEALWGRLGQLGMPVLVVAGADDAAFTERGRRLAATIGPNAELVVIEGAGHTVQLEQPERFLGALRGWLSRTA